MPEANAGFTDSFGNQWIEVATTCWLCGHDNTRPIRKIDNERYKWRTEIAPIVLQCRHCGLAWVTPRLVHDVALKPEESARQERLRENPASWEDPFTIYSHRQNLLAIEQYKSRGRILDVGCGPGWTLRESAERGWETYGVEPVDWQTKFARESFGLNVYNGKLCDAQFPSGFFDVVTMEDVLDHLVEPLSVLSEIYRILKPDGLLFIQVPDIESWESRLMGPRWYMLYSPGHSHFYSWSSLNFILRKAKFIIIKRILWAHGRHPLRNIIKYSLSKLGIATTSCLLVLAQKQA